MITLAEVQLNDSLTGKDLEGHAEFGVAPFRIGSLTDDYSGQQLHFAPIFHGNVCSGYCFIRFR